MCKYADWRNISRFVTNAIHSSTHSSPTSLVQILESFPENRQSSLRGPAPLCQLRSEVLHKKISICPAPLPPGQDRFKQFPTPGPEGLDLSRGLPRGGMVTGKIEPRINFKP